MTRWIDVDLLPSQMMKSLTRMLYPTDWEKGLVNRSQRLSHRTLGVDLGGMFGPLTDSCDQLVVELLWGGE